MSQRQRDNISANLKAGEYRYDTFEGRSHLIVPIVLMTEGVHNGSAGPLYYPADELSTLAESWNGVPVPVFHPENNGSPCTCNDPRVIEHQNVGRLFNVKWEDGRLKGEAWIDVQKAEAVYNGLIEMLKDSKTKMEVSTGLMSQHENVQGTWNGEDYEAIVRNIRPDHLALLPGSIGACSWADGCGVRVNSEKDIKKYIDNIMGQRESHRKIYNYLDSLDNGNYIHMMEEVYDGYFIYRRESINNANGTAYFKAPYKFKENDDLEVMSNEIVQVKKTVSFETITNEDKGEANMAKRTDGKTTENQCPDCKQLVDALIANEATNWKEEDRSFLEEFDADALRKMTPVENKEEKKVENKEKKVENKEEKVENKEEKKVPTTKEYIDNAPAEIRDVLNSAMSVHKAKKQELIATITKNSRNKFTKEQLEAKGMEELEMLSELATEPNYSGQVGSIESNQAEDNGIEALGLPVVNYEKK